MADVEDSVGCKEHRMVWRRLFKPQEQPQNAVEHATLGTLLWEPNEKEWRGTYNGLAFSIGKDREAVPPAELLDYAMALLGHKDDLLQALETEKRRWVEKYPAAADEIEPLQFDEFALYRHKGVCKAFVLLSPECADKAWRIEFAGLDCKGLGFDS
jgi:hypothetical protein